MLESPRHRKSKSMVTWPSFKLCILIPAVMEWLFRSKFRVKREHRWQSYLSNIYFPRIALTFNLQIDQKYIRSKCLTPTFDLRSHISQKQLLKLQLRYTNWPVTLQDRFQRFLDDCSCCLQRKWQGKSAWNQLPQSTNTTATSWAC